MAKFRYIGDQPHGNCLGLQFPRNIYVEVENPVHQKKLAGNPAFQQANLGRPTRAEADAAAAAKAQAEAEEKARAEAEAKAQAEAASKPTGEAVKDGDEGSGKEPGAD